MADELGYFVKNASNQTFVNDFGEFFCGTIDLTNPAAYQWYKDGRFIYSRAGPNQEEGVGSKIRQGSTGRSGTWWDAGDTPCWGGSGGKAPHKPRKFSI